MQTRKGFTLIEILVVIVIIGILATFIVPSVVGAPARARDLARQTTMNNIKAAITAYAADNGKLPGSGASPTTYCINPADTTSGLAKYFDGGTPPADPKGDIDISGDDTPACIGYYYLPLKASATSSRITGYALFSIAEVEGSATVGCTAAAVSAGSDYYMDDVTTKFAQTGSPAYPVTANDSDTWCMYTLGSF